MDTIYVFSGLGADRRVFEKLDLSGLQVIYIDWLKPRPSEAFESYVFRLADHYQIPKQGALVMGVSFGGMCIVELAKYYDFKKTILISSAKTKDELPKVLGVSKLLSLHKLLPEGANSKTAAKVLHWLFGAKTEEEKRMLDAILKDSDPDFQKWAVDKIVNWENSAVPVNCLHIHGDKDRLIPIQYVDYTIRIKGGGHMMVWNKAAELSYPIRNFLF
jgi:pimeloyl-ACP methyl ester carboxylesterase